jgi:hypothetical protein
MSARNISFVCAVFDDFYGLWPTLQSIRLHDFQDGDEIVVVDNNPASLHGRDSMNVVSWMKDVARYIPLASPVGTAVPRDRAIAEAKNEIVICFDPHVLFPPGAIDAVRSFFEANPKSKDLVSGPLLYDDLKQYATHFADVWRGEMWGIWATDSRGNHIVTYPPPKLEPGQTIWTTRSPHLDTTAFEIPGCGLGAFAVRKAAWPGFNPNFRGFGGEELYVHEKIRRAGGRNLCLPAFRWVHRFGRPDGVKYPLTLWNKVRNYVIGHRELGLPLDRVHRHFVEGLNEDGTPTRGYILRPDKTTYDEKNKAWVIDPSNRQANPPPLTEDEWKFLIASDPPPESPPAPKGCGSCGGAAANSLSLDQWYEQAAKTPGDINEHVPTLRELASKCDHVTEFGVRRGVSTVALLAGQPKRLISYDLNATAEAAALKQKQGGCEFEFRIGDSQTVPIEETDMLFIDTKHTAGHLAAELGNAAAKVKKWIVLHDTVIFGERGEDGGAGLLPAVRQFLQTNREWTVIRHDLNNNGLMVLSRDDGDKKQPPGTFYRALNFTKALAEHAKDGLRLVDDETWKGRLDLCMLCPNRFYDTCGLCGCPVDKKTSWASSECPDNPPRWGKVELEVIAA